MENEYVILVRKPEEEKPLGRPKCRRKNNILMNLGENGIEWCTTDSFD